MKPAIFGLAAGLAAGLASPCWAQNLNADQKFTETQIGFDLKAKYDNLTLSITGPNGFHTSQLSKSDPPSVDLRRLGTLDDGEYNYQLTGSTGDRVPVRTALDNGRPGGPSTTALVTASKSGQFQVKGGKIVQFDPSAREPVARQK